MGTLSADVGPFELSGDAPQVQDEVGLIAIELVDDVAVAHEVKDGATEVLSLQSCPVLASTTTLGVGLVAEVGTLVTALHPRKRCGFQRGHPPQTPEQSRHDVHELFLNEAVGCVGRDEFGPELLILRHPLALENEAARRQTMLQRIAPAASAALGGLRAAAVMSVSGDWLQFAGHWPKTLLLDVMV